MAKIAVLITGIFPAYLKREDLQINLNRIEQIFGGCDFYYQTWNTPLYRHIFKNVNRNILWVPEPTTNYNPYDYAKEKYFGDKPGIRRMSMKPKNDTRKELVMKACFQHLGFSALWNEVPKKYDMYVRTRWDAFIHKNFPLDEMLSLAQDRVVGIATVPNKFRSISLKNQYETVANRRGQIKSFVDRGFYCIIEHDTQNINHAAYDNFLADFVILFKESDYVTGSAERLYTTQELSGAEFGWHELLCSQRPHVNIDGLAAILRNTDASRKTFEKLKEAKLL